MSNPHYGQVVIEGIMTPNQFDLFKREILQRIDEIAEKIDGDEDEFFTTEEACEYLKIGKTKLYQLADKGIIEKHRLGGSVRYEKANLRKAILEDSIT